MVSITLKNVTKRFGSVVALDNVDLEIQQGEIFFLLGPSGCGKTTLLRTVAGFYTPDDGSLFFDQQEVSHLPPHKRNSAMVFQSYALWPHMNVGENVSFGLRRKRLPRGIIEERVKRALRMVKMEEYAARRINQLSGGQQQRVALARALVVEPRCLLLDEPLSNLDAQLRLEMRLEIKRICQEAGLTTIYVTHDQKEALSIADRLAVLENGTISQIGSPQEVYRTPITRSVASFIGETNFITGRLIEQERQAGYWSVETKAGTFIGRVSQRKWKPKYTDRVILSVRPESLTLSRTAPRQNFVSGKIVGQTYLGETVQYELESQELGTPVRISQINPRQLEGASELTYYAEARPEDVVILQR